MISRLFLAGFAGLLIGSCGSSDPEPPRPTPSPQTERAVSQGNLIGFVDDSTGAHIWRSVPFAAPPVDDLRWRAPRPAADWDETLEAIDHPERCPQELSRLDGADEKDVGTIIGNEDCLYLNIYAPATATDTSNLPVMLWIHGGSNTWGYAAQYDGGELANRHDVVVVVVQYRLGPIGWFAHETLRASAETDRDRAANFGILDQIAALEWVRDNIDAFGGDAGNVTIFGESAGGHNVATLLASPLAEGLFHRAIVQSGAFRSTSLSDAEGVTGDEATPARVMVERALPDTEAPTAEELRAIPVETLYGTYDDTGLRDVTPPRIIEDGVVLPQRPLYAQFSAPELFNDVPVMTGTNRDETKLFNLFIPDLVKQRFGRFPVARDPDLYNAISDHQSKMWRVLSVDDRAEQMTRGGHTDVFAYRFDWDEAGKVWFSDFAQLFGAAHALEIPFVFGRFEFLGEADKWVFTEKNEAARVALSDAMMSYWAQFARTGDPGQGVSGNLPEWSRWGEGSTFMVFDTDADGGIRMADDIATAEGVRAEFEADPRLAETEDRCKAYAYISAWYPEFGDAPEACIDQS